MNGEAFNNWFKDLLNTLIHCSFYEQTQQLKVIYQSLLLNQPIKYFIKKQTLLPFENLLTQIFVKLNDHNIKLKFNLSPGYTASDQLALSLQKNDKSGTKYLNWKQTFTFWNKCKQQLQKNEISVVLTPHIGHLINYSTRKFGDGYHCRLILTIFIDKNDECLFCVYDCNGTKITVEDLICHSNYNITQNDLEKFPFLYHINDTTASLNGVGYYLNQWIKFYLDNSQYLEIGTCYFFILWSCVAVTNAIMYNKDKILRVILNNNNDNDDWKEYIILLLGYEMQRLVFCNIIQDARESLLFKINKNDYKIMCDTQINKNENDDDNETKIIKGARTKQRSKGNKNRGKPKKQQGIFKPRSNNNNNNVLNVSVTTNKQILWLIFKKTKKKKGER